MFKWFLSVSLPLFLKIMYISSTESVIMDGGISLWIWE